MLKPLSPRTLRSLERGLLWFTAPSLVVSAFVAIALASGSANAHGGTGYTLLLLTILVPIGLIATLLVLPVLVFQYRQQPAELESPLARTAIVVAVAFIGLCSLLAWQSGAQLFGPK